MLPGEFVTRTNPPRQAVVDDYSWSTGRAQWAWQHSRCIETIEFTRQNEGMPTWSRLHVIPGLQSKFLNHGWEHWRTRSHILEVGGSVDSICCWPNCWHLLTTKPYNCLNPRSFTSLLLFSNTNEQPRLPQASQRTFLISHFQLKASKGLNPSVCGPLVLVAAQVDAVPSAVIQRQDIKTLRRCLVRWHEYYPRHIHVRKIMRLFCFGLSWAIHIMLNHSSSFHNLLFWQYYTMFDMLCPRFPRIWAGNPVSPASRKILHLEANLQTRC